MIISDNSNTLTVSEDHVKSRNCLLSSVSFLSASGWNLQKVVIIISDLLQITRYFSRLNLRLLQRQLLCCRQREVGYSVSGSEAELTEGKECRLYIAQPWYKQLRLMHSKASFPYSIASLASFADAVQYYRAIDCVHRVHCV